MNPGQTADLVQNDPVGAVWSGSQFAFTIT